MHWVRWDKVVSSRGEGGLGVGSLFSFNRSLLFRWWWRFYHCPNLLWIHLVKAIYGTDGGVRSLIPKRSYNVPWNGIIRMLVQPPDRGLRLQSMCLTRWEMGGSLLFGMISG